MHWGGGLTLGAGSGRTSLGSARGELVEARAVNSCGISGRQQGLDWLRRLEGGNSSGPAVVSTEGMMVETGESRTIPETQPGGAARRSTYPRGWWSFGSTSHGPAARPFFQLHSGRAHPRAHGSHFCPLRGVIDVRIIDPEGPRLHYAVITSNRWPLSSLKYKALPPRRFATWPSVSDVGPLP